MKNFTYEEVNLMALYNTGNRERLIEVLTEMRSYLTWSEVELRDLTDSTLDKLAGMTDAEFDALELYLTFNLKRPPDFRGHSLSVSDVVVLNREGKAGAFYVDRIGFKEQPGFLEQMKEAARQKPVAEQIRQAKEAAPKVKTKKHKERDTR